VRRKTSASTAPNSAEAHELDAEALESQNKWEDATAEYKGILEQNPQMPAFITVWGASAFQASNVGGIRGSQERDGSRAGN